MVFSGLKSLKIDLEGKLLLVTKINYISKSDYYSPTKISVIKL